MPSNQPRLRPYTQPRLRSDIQPRRGLPHVTLPPLQSWGNVGPPPLPPASAWSTVKNKLRERAGRLGKVGIGAAFGTLGILGGASIPRGRPSEDDEYLESDILAENRLRRSLLRDYPQSDLSRDRGDFGVPTGVIGTYPESNYEDGTWGGTHPDIAREGVPYGLPAHPAHVTYPEVRMANGRQTTFHIPEGDRMSMYRQGYTPAVERARRASEMEGSVAHSFLR